MLVLLLWVLLLGVRLLRVMLLRGTLGLLLLTLLRPLTSSLPAPGAPLVCSFATGRPHPLAM